MKDEAKDKFNNKLKKARLSTNKRETSSVDHQQQMDALKQDVKIAEDKAKQLGTTLNTIRQANISSASKRKHDSLLQSTCDNLIDTREYNSAWIALFDESGNIITSAHSGVGHEFKSIINRLKIGKSLKCIENALSNPDVIVSDNPMINCCECPLSMLYYGIECISIRFKYHTSYGIITASLPHTLAHDKKEQKFIKVISDSLSSALYTIELEEERTLIEGDLRESEEKHRLLLENLNEGVCQIDAEGMTTFVNPSMARMLGYTENELIGNHFLGFFSKTAKLKASHIWEQRKKREQEQFTLEFIKKDGAALSTNVGISPILNAEGEYIGSIVSVQDITERMRAEETLKESEDRYRLLADNVSDIIMLMDVNLKVSYFSPSITSVLGYSVEEALAGPMEGRMTPASIDEAIRQFRAGLAREKRRPGSASGQTLELEMIHKDGSIVIIEMIASFIRDKNGKPAGILGILRNITERKKAEEKIALNTQHIKAILNVAQMINQTPTMNKMLASALDKLNEVMSTDKACLYLIDFENKCLKMKAYSGLTDKNIRRYSNLKLTEEQLHNLLTWKGHVTSFETIFGKTTGDRLKAALERNKARSYSMVPLVLQDKVVGILYNISDDARTITEDDIEFLTAIAYEISIGINNIQLMERTIELSLTDALTGLYNRRHFYESLETEMSRTKRYGLPFSLIILDLDGFKGYNDKFGHTSGDGVLQLFAKELKSSLRKTDIACRYGGDEFAIILPSADSKTAKTTIERFRVRWRKNSEKLLKGPIDFSCGIAKFPDNSDSSDGLVFLADAAMYCAKTDKAHKSMLAAEISSISSGVLQAANQDHVYALAATVDAKDPYTYGHSKRVAAIAEKIGKAIGLSQEALSRLYSAALLHDIGKIGVPDSILTKPDRLTPEEYEIIKRHSAEGARIVGYIKELTDIVPAILHHHEWYNGNGYPYGLKGNSIPLGARITSVADAYDTMTTERPYRNTVSPEQACEELTRCSGTQFDPMIVGIWCKTIMKSN